MARIKVKDLHQNTLPSEEEAQRIQGGFIEMNGLKGNDRLFQRHGVVQMNGFVSMNGFVEMNGRTTKWLR